MNWANIVRTWFFLDRILDWYNDFNAVRTEFYRQRGMIERTLPASTGIGARNPAGAALVAGAWAWQPAGKECVLQEVPSPLQGPASSYGSSFTRAAELVSPGLRRVFVSGTASIAHDGHTEYPGSLKNQVELTMRVVRAILQTRGLDFCDVTRATAYVKRRGFAPVFDAWREARGLAQWPVITARADICREDLLFEIELDALGRTTT
jgi:enamine deaminase RidA (YjgF/YER057c/UK114 family)